MPQTLQIAAEGAAAEAAAAGSAGFARLMRFERPNAEMIFLGLKDELNRDDLNADISQFGPDGKIKK